MQRKESNSGAVLTARHVRQTSNVTTFGNYYPNHGGEKTQTADEERKFIGKCEYFSETHKQWMGANIITVNGNATRGIISYHLDIKANAKLAKIRNTEFSKEYTTSNGSNAVGLNHVPAQQEMGQQVVAQQVVAQQVAQQPRVPTTRSLSNHEVPSTAGTIYRTALVPTFSPMPRSESQTLLVETKVKPEKAQELDACVGCPVVEGRDLRDEFTLGEEVHYYSETHQTEMKAIVKLVKANRVDLDVKRNASVHRIRRHTSNQAAIGSRSAVDSSRNVAVDSSTANSVLNASTFTARGCDDTKVRKNVFPTPCNTTSLAAATASTTQNAKPGSKTICSASSTKAGGSAVVGECAVEKSCGAGPVTNSTTVTRTVQKSVSAATKSENRDTDTSRFAQKAETPITNNAIRTPAENGRVVATNVGLTYAQLGPTQFCIAQTMLKSHSQVSILSQAPSQYNHNSSWAASQRFDSNVKRSQVVASGIVSPTQTTMATSARTSACTRSQVVTRTADKNYVRVSSNVVPMTQNATERTNESVQQSLTTQVMSSTPISNATTYSRTVVKASPKTTMGCQQIQSTSTVTRKIPSSTVIHHVNGTRTMVGGGNGGYGGSRNNSLRNGEVHRIQEIFNPSSPSQCQEVKKWLKVPTTAEIKRLEGFQGGLNMGIYEVSGGNLAQPQILKIIKAAAKHPGLLSEGDNLAKLQHEIPQIQHDMDTTFPFAIHRVEHIGEDGKPELLDVLAMRKASGCRLSEHIANVWYSSKRTSTYSVLAKLGKFLKAFHLRYGNREHGDVNPSNIFYDEETDHITLIDVGGMGQKTAKTDKDHFIDSIRMIGNSYGEELSIRGIEKFRHGYDTHFTSRSVNLPGGYSQC